MSDHDDKKPTSEGPAGVIAAVRYIDDEDLICPGCHEPVSAQPPANIDPASSEVPQFSHRDGSGLCGQDAGSPIEPIERGVLW